MWPVHVQLLPDAFSKEEPCVHVNGSTVMVKEGDKVYGYQVTSSTEGVDMDVGREELKTWVLGGEHNMVLVSCGNKETGLPKNIMENVTLAVRLAEERGVGVECTATRFHNDGILDMVAPGRPRYRRSIFAKSNGVLRKSVLASSECRTLLRQFTSPKDVPGPTLIAVTITSRTSTATLLVLHVTSVPPLFTLGTALRSIRSGADGVTDYTAKSTTVPTVMHNYLVGKPCSRYLIVTVHGSEEAGVVPMFRFATELATDVVVAPKEVSVNTTLQDIVETHDIIPHDDSEAYHEGAAYTSREDEAWAVVMSNAERSASPMLQPRGGKKPVKKSKQSKSLFRTADVTLKQEIQQLEDSAVLRESRLQHIEDAAIMVKQENLQVAGSLRDAQQLNTKLNYDLRRARLDYSKLQEQHQLTLRVLQQEVDSRKETETVLKQLKDRSITSLREQVKKNITAPIRGKQDTSTGDIKIELIEVKKENLRLKKKLNGGGRTMKDELAEHQKILETLRERVKRAEEEVGGLKMLNEVLTEQKRAITHELEQAESSRDKLLDAVKMSPCSLHAGSHLLHAASNELLSRSANLPASPTTDAAQALHATLQHLLHEIAVPPDTSGLSKLPPAIHNEISRLHALNDLLETAQSLHTNMLEMERS
eukprot:TRINITY_DN22514_c0_g1_i1.p1 TRINITY_DN22514_c0_g1~~TRINITY_DN22514_c0_g1_i1.p1  ORF type:complete len:664 (+),score=202.25 TRINITY_DN22514_c0_g1_i1:44-1993(+)